MDEEREERSERPVHNSPRAISRTGAGRTANAGGARRSFREEAANRGEAPSSTRFSRQDRPEREGSPRLQRTSGVGKKGTRGTNAAQSTLDEPMRLNKFLAHCGVSARRQAADYVKNGLVTVNGEVERNPSYPVQPKDKVTFKGKLLKIEEAKVYILMNKPKDVITTASDEKGRKTVLDLLKNSVTERVFPVGRLDRQTTGLLLITNDGELAEKLSHPSHKVQKIYTVTLDKPLHRADIEKIQKGLELEDGIATVDSLHIVSENKKEIELGLHVGKNRIVRRIFEHLGYEVEKLDRTYYAGLTKKDIGRGHFRHLTEKEVIMLKHFK